MITLSPPPIKEPFLNGQLVSSIWIKWLVNAYNRLGQSHAPSNADLNNYDNDLTEQDAMGSDKKPEQNEELSFSQYIPINIDFDYQAPTIPLKDESSAFDNVKASSRIADGNYITGAKLTVGGVNGSITIQQGIIVAITPAS